MAFRIKGGGYAPMGCGRVGCPGCGKRHALTALEMVRDTSARMGNPDVAITLTSANADCETGARWSKDLEQVIRALRRRWPMLAYLAFMEWNTGNGSRSGGLRRPHTHMLGRGMPREDAAEAEAISRRVWLGRTGAHRVEVAPLVVADDC